MGISRTNSRITVTDKAGGKLIFSCDSGVQNGRLTCIRDANGNEILISYANANVTDLRISSVTEKLSGGTEGQSVVLEYLDGHLAHVTSPDRQRVSYTYDGSDLIGVAYEYVTPPAESSAEETPSGETPAEGTSSDETLPDENPKETDGCRRSLCRSPTFHRAEPESYRHQASRSTSRSTRAKNHSQDSGTPS